MLRFVRFALAMAAPALLAPAAVAQTGLYLSGSAGGNFVLGNSRSVTIHSGGLSYPGTNTTTYNPGENVNAALGYHLPMGLRLEGELGYQHYSAATISPNTNGAVPFINGTRLSDPSGGDARTFTATGNVFYDLPYTFAGITPYVGGGAGFYYGSIDRAVYPEPLAGGAFTSGGSTKRGAVVLGEAGLSYAVTRTLSLTAAYRYEHFFHPSSGVEVGANIVKLGLRYEFGAPPMPVAAAAVPVAAAAPAVAPARSYLVFFDWDKATLSARARQIIAEAASASTRVRTTSIHVNGYTDTSGTPQYNQGLSVRRAEAVAAELVKDGVPRGSISIRGFGETHLLVPTGPGVREPQNRRVEIILG